MKNKGLILYSIHNKIIKDIKNKKLGTMKLTDCFTVKTAGFV